MGRITKIIGHPFVQFVGPTGVAAVITWLFGHLANIPIMYIWLSILVAVSVTLWFILQIKGWREVHQKKITELSDKELEILIWDWLKMPTWAVKPMPLEKETVFAYNVKFQDIPIDIVKERPQPDIIFLITVFTLPLDEHGLSTVEQDRLYGQLHIEFARLGIQWDRKENTNTIRLTEPLILDDSITPYNFRSRVMFVIRAEVLAFELWKDAVRQKKSTPDKEDSQT